MVIILRDDLTIANEYKDKYKVSYAKLDELLKDRRDTGDTSGLGFEHGESFGTANEDQKVNQNQRSPVKQPNAYKFNGRCFVCNIFGHMARHCRKREN